MTSIERARCPECGKAAYGYDEVQELFGTRNNKGKFLVQSWCRKCRNKLK